MKIKIAIDGPAGAGKSTISKEVAKCLGYLYIDTGAMYRAVALKALNEGVDVEDKESVKKMLEDISITLKNDPDGQKVFLDGKDVTKEIRQEKVSILASKVAMLYEVREKLVNMQRQLAENENVVMDGRDIGTNVLPDAQIKIFLTASEEERAKRRYEELINKGVAADYSEVLKDLKIRDYQDSTREFAPLKKADDAYLIDTTGNTLEKSISFICDFVKDKLKEKGL